MFICEVHIIIIWWWGRGSVPGGSTVKNSPTSAGDADSIPGSGRSPEEGNGNPFQCSCLGNPMWRGACWSAVHGFAESGMTATKQQ